MAINTTIRRAAFNPLPYGNVNLTFVATTGFAAGTMIGIGGDIAAQLIFELPSNQWRVEIVKTATSSQRPIIRPGDVASDTTVPA
jgi:hypothetical protein